MRSFISTFLLSSLTLIFLSCSGNQIKETAWEKQMDDIVKESMMSDLSLVSYSFLMSLKSEDDYSNALERMFDDDAVIAFGTVDNPFFTTVGEVKKETTTNDTSSFKLDEFIKSGTGLVKTVWRFKSQLYNSLAVVSDDRGIVYDNIGWYLVSKKDSRTKSELEDEPIE